MSIASVAKSFAYTTHAPARDHRVYGHVELGKWANVLDCMHVPYLGSTFVLVHESHYGSTGGLAKDVVLYAVTRNGRREIERHMITHQFDRSRDCLFNWGLTKIRVEIRHRVVDKNLKVRGPLKRYPTFKVYVSAVTTKGNEWSRPGCYVNAEHMRLSMVRPGNMLIYPKYRVTVFKKHSVQMLDGKLSKKSLRRLLEQWGFLSMPPLCARSR